MSDSPEKSGVHLTGNDSGWPVGGEDEPGYVKDGTGADKLPNATAVAGGRITDDGTDEAQKVTETAATGGSFTLTFDGKTTADIAFDATGAQVQTALEALNNVEPGDVKVTGVKKGPWDIVFEGQYADEDVPQMTANGAKLTGEGKEIKVATTTAGKPR